jgi:hypothetical protein
MIKASELRIGNLVKYDKRVFEIDIIAHEFPTLNTAEFGIGVVDWNNIEPIPLTEEWLLKFGIDFTSEKEWYHLTFTIKDLLFETSSSIKGFTYNLCFDNQINFQYVHQLQNLYFALTGEELTIKEVNNEQ